MPHNAEGEHSFLDQRHDSAPTKRGVLLEAENYAVKKTSLILRVRTDSLPLLAEDLEPGELALLSFDLSQVGLPSCGSGLFVKMHIRYLYGSPSTMSNQVSMMITMYKYLFILPCHFRKRRSGSSSRPKPSVS